MMDDQAYKVIVSDYFLSSKPTHISQKMLFEIYEQLKELDQKDMIKVFKLIEFIKQNISNENHQKRMNAQLNDELLKDIKGVLQAHQTNMRMLGYSPLIGFIFNYYVYVKYFKSDVSKFSVLIEPLKKELNQGLSEYLRDSNDRIVKKFYRLSSMRFTKHTEILVSEKRKNRVKNQVEALYKKKIHNDTFQIIFLKILVENNLLSIKNGNELLKKLFNIENYISENYLQKDEVKNIINRGDFIFYLSINVGILIPNEYIKRVEK